MPTNHRPARRNLAAVAAVAAAALALGCADGAGADFADPVRPQLDQVVLTGELALDRGFDGLVGKGGARRELRRPLTGLYEILKGSDLFPERTATFAPLGAGLSAAPCAGADAGCHGRPELAEALRQAGIDAVSLAAPRISASGDRVRGDTGQALERLRICTTDAGSSPCARRLGEARVALAAVRAGGTDATVAEAKRAVAAARREADVVVLAVAFAASASPDGRAEIMRRVSDEAQPEIALGHGADGFAGVELRGGRLVLHDPGPLLGATTGGPEQRFSFLFRCHFTATGLAWAEAIPARHLERRTRWAYSGEAQEALAALVERSRRLGYELRTAHGRGIIAP